MRPNAFCRCFVIVVTLFTQHATALRASLRTSNPVTVASVELLGNVNSTNTYVFRDLGFQGTIGGKTYLTYGDTNYEVAGSDGFHGIVSDSIAMATSDPLKVTDMDLGSSGWPNQFCPLMDGETSSTDAMGITNVVETIPGSGILYFLKNHRPNGVNQIIGAGVANITFDGATPVATRLSEYWWDGKTEPWYGDVCAFGDGDYVYAYGHGPTGNYTFVTRALKKEATDLNSYEYWNGATWQTDRLTNPTSAGSVFWQADQGQVIFSKYYNAYMFVYTDNYWDKQVLALVADAPEGPWSDPVTLYTATPLDSGGNVYAAVPHDYYDTSGKTLVVTFTNRPNTIQAIKVTFS